MSVPSQADDINTIASFLGTGDLSSLSDCPSVDCIILCISQVLHQTECLFRALEQRPDLTRTLVIVGGIGHSTQAVYDAVAQHPQFHTISPAIEGLSEARVLERLLLDFFDHARITSQGCRIIYEDQSTNCGNNATYARRVLERVGVALPRKCIIVQDPIMLLRTRVSFEKAYEDTDMPRFLICSIFVPQVRQSDSTVEYVNQLDGLWPLDRFLGLVMGEIPRLRDDEHGYGPKGKAFLPHVDIPDCVEAAYSRLLSSVEGSR